MVVQMEICEKATADVKNRTQESIIELDKVFREEEAFWQKQCQSMRIQVAILTLGTG